MVSLKRKLEIILTNVLSPNNTKVYSLLYSIKTLFFNIIPTNLTLHNLQLMMAYLKLCQISVSFLFNLIGMNI